MPTSRSAELDLSIGYMCRYVPADWGHAIVNVRPSIGFAGEFRMVNSIPKPPTVDGARHYNPIGKD
eukprot:SAG31_NODE_6853_length_1870_cov_1.264822_1_plen_65_part_10